jgi:hypothetical protein
LGEECNKALFDHASPCKEPPHASLYGQHVASQFQVKLSVPLHLYICLNLLSCLVQNHHPHSNNISS